MLKSFTLATIAAAAAATVLLAGCGSTYYSVKDPVGGKTYYTKEVDDVSGGAVKFKDAKTGATVTIQNSAVKEVSEQEFNVGIYAAEPAKPAPVPAPAPIQVQVSPAPAPAPVQIQVSPAPAPAPAPTQVEPAPAQSK